MLVEIQYLSSSDQDDFSSFSFRDTKSGSHTIACRPIISLAFAAHPIINRVARRATIVVTCFVSKKQGRRLDSYKSMAQQASVEGYVSLRHVSPGGPVQ